MYEKRNREQERQEAWIMQEVQAGAATFRGTRILVRPIVAALRRGVPANELIEDYGLSQEQITAARVYAAARPQRGRPPISGSG